MCFNDYPLFLTSCETITSRIVWPLRWPIGTKQNHKPLKQNHKTQNRITKLKTESQNSKQNHKTQNRITKPKTEAQNPKKKHKTQNRNTKLKTESQNPKQNHKTSFHHSIFTHYKRVEPSVSDHPKCHVLREVSTYGKGTPGGLYREDARTNLLYRR